MYEAPHSEIKSILVNKDGSIVGFRNEQYDSSDPSSIIQIETMHALEKWLDPINESSSEVVLTAEQEVQILETNIAERALYAPKAETQPATSSEK